MSPAAGILDLHCDDDGFGIPPLSDPPGKVLGGPKDHPAGVTLGAQSMCFCCFVSPAADRGVEQFGAIGCFPESIQLRPIGGPHEMSLYLENGLSQMVGQAFQVMAPDSMPALFMQYLQHIGGGDIALGVGDQTEFIRMASRQVVNEACQLFRFPEIH